jgi:hypothetical protein
MTHTDAPRILLPAMPDAAPLTEAVLFGFDSWAFPFQCNVRTHLAPGQQPRLVLRPGPAGSHDEVILYYGTVIRIGETFHMWYNGNYGPLQNTIGFERKYCCICYATSRDGVTWEKPDLGLVEFNGSKSNNICDFPASTLWSTAAVCYDPDAPDPARRYKMAYEAFLTEAESGLGGRMHFCVAFSPDGLRWTPSPLNPVGPFLEMAGVARHNGLYYVNGQGRGYDAQRFRRHLVTYASEDFEHWSPCGALGLRRAPDLGGPATEDGWNNAEEVHLGAALWHRGNVMLGIYGQWHGNSTGERRFVTMDLGLALTHDAIHFYEPISGFRIVPAREQPEAPLGFGPALMQGQGMENVGDRTLYWYSNWRGTEGSGVRMVSWPRDRLGMLRPFGPDNAQALSCPIRVVAGSARLYANASGLGPHSQLRIGLMDAGFRPVPGYSGDDAAVMAADGFRFPLRWRAGDTLPDAGPYRIHVQFEGIRPEDCRLHAIYVGA